MPPFGPISRSNLVRALRKAGFEGPFAGGTHAFMVRGNLTLSIPDPHRGDITRSAEPDIAAGRGIPGGMGSVVITIHSAGPSSPRGTAFRADNRNTSQLSVSSRGDPDAGRGGTSDGGPLMDQASPHDGRMTNRLLASLDAVEEIAGMQKCTSCGHGFLVAFSCKGRGVCPSCTGRRMAQTAAHPR